MNKKINLSLALGLMIVFSALSFWAGTKYQGKSSNVDNNAMMANFRANIGERGVNNGRMMIGNSEGQLGGQIVGEIIKMEDNIITLSLGEQGSKLIYLNDDTVINKLEVQEKSELKMGDRISVMGIENDNQSILANIIQIR